MDSIAATAHLNPLRADLQAAPFDKVVDLWELIEQDQGVMGKAWLGRNDRYYLLTRLLHRFDAVDQWLYARCREVESDPDGYLDLWAREHYKSTIITFAGCIQEIINDPEITIGIFSFNKPTARKFLSQIKQELETNRDLQAIYPDVFYPDPKNQSPKWSEEKGLVVRRNSNPKEATLEAHGLVDGQPTGAHFILRLYDDVVVPASVSTPDQVKKTTLAWELSDNLGARSADGFKRAWHVGTRYSFADTYQDIINKNALKLRVYPATDNGLPDGNPVFLSRAAWAQLKMKQGPATVACQQLMNPAAGNEAMFRKEWLSFADVRPATLNVYIMVDPAHSKKKGSDNTAMAVIGVDAAGNKFLLDGYRHKMGLKERWQALRGLRKVWMAQPGVQMVKVGYERYGMQADLEYFEEQMLADKESFPIHELNWTSEGGQSKDDRVQRLQPDFQSKKFFLAQVCTRLVKVGVDSKGVDLLEPQAYETKNQIKARESGQAFRIFAPVKRRDHEGNVYSLNKGFLEEYLTYPFSAKKDLIDAASRVYDMDPVPPVIVDQRALEPETYDDGA
jgi:phage terminase large subunit-like protein